MVEQYPQVIQAGPGIEYALCAFLWAMVAVVVTGIVLAIYTIWKDHN